MFSFLYLTKKTTPLLNNPNYIKNKDYCNKSTQEYISRVIARYELERTQKLNINKPLKD
jgi:hypothetical protein